MRWKRHHFEYKETIVTFLCDGRSVGSGRGALLESRKTLEEYIRKVSSFRTTHLPFQPSEDSPDLIERMCLETRKVGVGPMAAVAGALAFEGLMSILKDGADEAVVDNGGDIALFIREPVRVGLFAGNSSLRELVFEVEPRNRPFGICTSSGTVGHSFSYGRADAAVVVSSNVLLADAAATALGNQVKEEKDLETCFTLLEDLSEIEGALVVFGDRVALWGTLPRLLRSQIDLDLITRGKAVCMTKIPNEFRIYNLFRPPAGRAGI